VGDYEVTYESPTSNVDPEKLTFGAVLRVEKDGKPFATLAPSRNYYAGRGDPSVGPLRGFFEGEATSEVGRTGGAAGDLWTSMRPDLTRYDRVIDAVDERLGKLASSLEVGDSQDLATYARAQGEAIGRFALVYEANSPPVDFRVNYNPLVIWLWVGGAIAVAGGLVAIWPAPAARRRRVADVHAARLARELGRA
jgi:cytochrome c-type biogenesis protein CcmF